MPSTETNFSTEMQKIQKNITSSNATHTNTAVLHHSLVHHPVEDEDPAIINIATSFHSSRAKRESRVHHRAPPLLTIVVFVQVSPGHLPPGAGGDLKTEQHTTATIVGPHGHHRLVLLQLKRLLL